MSINGTIKKIAASTAIAGSLGLGGLGLACGVATAAPTEHAGAGSGSSTNSGQHAHSASKPPTSGDSEVHAHLIPGFSPMPAAATTSRLGVGEGPDDDPDSPLNCHEPRCEEIIHE
jgi:hypothetical protein